MKTTRLLMAIVTLLVVFVSCAKESLEKINQSTATPAKTFIIKAGASNMASDTLHASPDIVTKFWLENLPLAANQYSFIWNLAGGTNLTTTEPEKSFTPGLYQISVTCTPIGGGTPTTRSKYLRVAPDVLAFSPEWQKLKAPFLENIKKVTNMGNRLMLLTSNKDYYYSCDKSFKNWLKESFPNTSSDPSPVAFNGYLYLNTDQGVYRFLNSYAGWEKISDIVAKKIIANKKSLFLIKNAGEWKNDSLICFDGKSFYPNLALQNLENSVNNKLGTSYTSFNFAQSLGDTLFVSYIHRANNWTGIAFYYSYDSGKSWVLYDSHQYSLYSMVIGAYSEKGTIGQFYSDQNGYQMPMFVVKGSYNFSQFGQITAFENSAHNTSSDFWFTARIDTASGYQTHVNSYAIFNGEDIQLKTKTPLSDIKLLDRQLLVAVGDSGIIYALRKHNF